MRFAMIARTAMVLSITGAALALPACSGSNHAEATPALIAAVNSPIADVPIPAGFGMTGQSTSHVEASGVRTVDHWYSGSDDLLPVVKFYRDEMPKTGWAFADQNQLEHNQVALHFTKNSEDCVVTVKPGTFHTHIEVRINPVGGSGTK
jgi:hypothetical protein